MWSRNPNDRPGTLIDLNVVFDENIDDERVRTVVAIIRKTLTEAICRRADGLPRLVAVCGPGQELLYQLEISPPAARPSSRG